MVRRYSSSASYREVSSRLDKVKLAIDGANIDWSSDIRTKHTHGHDFHEIMWRPVLRGRHAAMRDTSRAVNRSGAHQAYMSGQLKGTSNIYQNKLMALLFVWRNLRPAFFGTTLRITLARSIAKWKVKIIRQQTIVSCARRIPEMVKGSGRINLWLDCEGKLFVRRNLLWNKTMALTRRGWRAEGR